MFFENWTQLGRTLLLAILSYMALVIFLRISGNRTLSKMNAFDLIVTIALGSTIASIITSQKVPLVQGLVALCCLILLQFSVTWLSVRSPRFARIIRSSPKLVVYKGNFLENEMKKNRITRQEIIQAIRSSGGGKFREVDAVVLETDGTLSIISNVEESAVLENVHVPKDIAIGESTPKN